MKNMLSLPGKRLLAQCLLLTIVLGEARPHSTDDIIPSTLPVRVSGEGKIITVSSARFRNRDITGPIAVWSVTNEEMLWEIWKKDRSGDAVFDRVAFEYGIVPADWEQITPRSAPPRKPAIGEVFLLRTGFRVTWVLFLSEGFGSSHSAFQFTDEGWVEIPVRREYLRPLVNHRSGAE